MALTPTHTITGKILRSDGTPSAGSLTFQPSTMIGNGARIIAAPSTVHLDHDGRFAVDLLATDAPGWTPAGWRWTVTENLPGGRPRRYFELTADVDYGDLVAVPEPTP